MATSVSRLGRKALEDVANTAKRETILGWYRTLVARKFDGSKARYLALGCQIERRLNDLVDPVALADELPSDRVNILLITARHRR